MPALTHLRPGGGVRMVDTAPKPVSLREAVASARVELGAKAFSALVRGEVGKGDVLTTAQLGGVMGAKDTSRLIPLCHNIALEAVDVACTLDEESNAVEVRAKARARARTGVEMEALTAVSVASLVIYDMCKAVSRGIRITDIRLESKTGGSRGSYRAAPAP